MKALSQAMIAEAFPPGERRRILLTTVTNWEELDFLSWIYRSGHLGYMVCETGDGVTGMVFERSVIRTAGPRQFMCDICLTVHRQGGAASFTRWDRSKTRSRTHILCADLGCSLYVRGLRKNGCVQMAETLSQSEKITRVGANLEFFVKRMAFGAASA